MKISKFAITESRWSICFGSSIHDEGGGCPFDLQQTSLLQALEKWDQIVPPIAGFKFANASGDLACFDVKETDFLFQRLPAHICLRMVLPFCTMCDWFERLRNAEMPDSFLKVPLIYQRGIWPFFRSNAGYSIFLPIMELTLEAEGCYNSCAHGDNRRKGAGTYPWLS